MAIIKIPKKKTWSPIVKEKRKAGTRAGLTKAAIVAAAAKLIESVGANGFSLRKLAKALGVGPTTIHFHFEGGVGAVSSAVAQQALPGVTRPFKPKEEPAAYLAEFAPQDNGGAARSTGRRQARRSLSSHKTIASLSPTEFPNLKEFREVLAAETVQGGVAKPQNTRTGSSQPSASSSRPSAAEPHERRRAPPRCGFHPQ